MQKKQNGLELKGFLNFFNGISFEDGVEINQKYINYLNQNVVQIKNAQKILQYLYQKQYEIYIITNGPIMAVNNKLSKINAKEYIKGTFTAEEAGHMKPNYEFFEKFFSFINTYKTEDMLIIGDELEKDVLGGIKNGIDTCWFNINKIVNNTNFKPTYEINNLIELKIFYKGDIING